MIYGDDDPDGVDHNVVVWTEADWLRDIDKELPFRGTSKPRESSSIRSTDRREDRRGTVRR